jgi:ubiquinone/menaquinone biosynthesis C-methylase UbiE
MQFPAGTARTAAKPVNHDDLVPPDEINFVGAGNFKVIGDEFLRYFVELGGLQPHERVLDVGCGIGRMALPLTQYLNERGSYEGFDVVPLGIDWCQKKYPPLFASFRFQLADIYNKHYTPNGRYRSDCFRFPYPTNSFDFVFLTSVFTHLLPKDMENYIYEIARVLKMNGRCLITYFLLNRESQRLVARKRGYYYFRTRFPHYQIVNQYVPEETVGYDEKFALQVLADYGLTVQPPIHYGEWCGREHFLSFQDIVVARKTRPLSLAQRVHRTWARLVTKIRDRGRPAARVKSGNQR